MSPPVNKPALVSDSDAPTRIEITPQPEFESHAIQAIAARYEVVSELGRGGMGMVLKVRDRETGDIVALKLLHPEIAANKEWEQRFKDELLLARKITHKNVCRVYELLRFGDTAAIAMEFVEGETLRQVMRRFSGLSLYKSIEVVKEICGGLREAHAQGVVHRDLKPENVIIDWSGSVHIMDFGLARSAASMTASSAESRGITGTPEYMSPEQASGKHADARSDIYALGLILYELLTRRTPFQADSAMVVALKHINEPPPAPRDIDPTIPHYVERAILRCLEKNPAKRYQKVEELEQALTSKERVKEAAVAEQEPEDVPLPMHLMRWQRSDTKVLMAAACGIVVFFALFSRYTQYHYVQFMSSNAAAEAAKRIGQQLGVTVEVSGCRPMLTVSDYDSLALRTEAAWIEAQMPRYGSAYECRVTPAGGSASTWYLRQDGKAKELTLSVRPPILPPESSPQELRRALEGVARDITGIDDEGLTSRASLDGRHLTLLAEHRPHKPDVNVNVYVDKSDFAGGKHTEFRIYAIYWSRQGWSYVLWRYWYGMQRKLLIAALTIAVVLFFTRRLHQRPPGTVAMSMALAITGFIVTSLGLQVRSALQEMLPDTAVYVWQGLTESIFVEWQAITDKLLIAAVDVALLMAVAAVVITLTYYGRRGDPVRTWVLFRYKEGWRTSLALAGIRGFLLGSCLAAGFVLLLASVHWTGSVLADSSWIVWIMTGTYWRPFVSDGPLMFAWKIFAVSVLEACVAGFLIAFPACVAARAGARPRIVVAVAALFWIVIQFSMMGMTTSDLVYTAPSIVLQAVFLVLVYWKYDLATAMATVFFGEMFAMGYAAYQTFRSLDSTYYTPALALWLVVAATAVVTYFRPQVSGGLRRAARVFE